MLNDILVNCYKSNNNFSSKLLLSDDTILETDYFSLLIESNDILDNIIVLITDYPFLLELLEKKNGKYTYSLSRTSLIKYFESEGFYLGDYSRNIEGVVFTKLFLNYPIGTAEIILLDDSTGTIISKSKINITSPKINEEEFETLVNYVESKSLLVWSDFSLLKNSAHLNDEFNKLDIQLLFYKNFIEELFKKYLNSFEYDQLKSLSIEEKVIDYSSEVEVNDNSLYWLVNNLDYLTPTNSFDFNKILIQNRLFRPVEILTTETKETTDIIENQFVHGFIDLLTQNISKTKHSLTVKNKENIKQSFYDFVSYYSIRKNIIQLDSFFLSLRKFKSLLEDKLPVSYPNLDFIPTNRIDSKDHYQFVYSKFIEWFNLDHAKYSDNNSYLKGISRMDKLFERACLYRIIDFFKKKDYRIDFVKEKDNVTESIKFVKHSKYVELYFECFPDGFGTKTGKWSLKPDFFILFDNGQTMILDAKYKKSENVKKYDWSNLALKYLHGIGHLEKQRFNPIGLFALVPIKNNTSEFYQNNKYDLNSSFPSLPSIGNICIDFEEKYSDFDMYMDKILNLVYSKY